MAKYCRNSRPARSGGLALTEPDAGTDLQAIRTRAVRDGDHYIVNGTKTWISNGIHGSCFALLVKTDPDAEPRHRGMSCSSAEKGEGFTVSRKLEEAGLQGHRQRRADLPGLPDQRRQPDRRRRGRGMQAALGGLELGRINIAGRGCGAGVRRADGFGALRPDPQDLRQADRRASGNPAQARRDGDAPAGSTPADL